MFIKFRYALFEKTKDRIEKAEGMNKFTQGFREFGIRSTPEGGIFCKEWAPGAKAIYLCGAFSELEIVLMKVN